MVYHLGSIANRGLNLNTHILAPAGEATISLIDDQHDIEAFGFPPAAPSLLDHLVTRASQMVEEREQRVLPSRT